MPKIDGPKQEGTPSKQEGTPSKQEGTPSKLVNRGPAGLLTKAKRGGKSDKLLQIPTVPSGPKNRVRCQGDVVDIAGLTPDPNNARLHPEFNIQLIKDSLNKHGQMKPLVVRKQGRIVVAGNGTMEAAKQLGWTKLAISLVSMSDVEAASYGLVDNRSAEFARWDFEVVARLDQLIHQAGQPTIGWSPDELLALRRQVESPDNFPIVDEGLEIEHICPKCGYQFSGGDIVEANGNATKEE